MASNLYKQRKKEEQKAKKEQNIADKKEKKLRKKLRTSFEWVDIENVGEDGIYLKKNEIVFGLKIEPINIFLLSEQEVVNRINALSMAFNHLTKRLYVQFPLTEPQLNETFNYFLTLQEKTNNVFLIDLIQTELNKIMLYENTHRDIWFYWMIKTNQKNYEDDVKQFIKFANTASMSFTKMSLQDYQNVILDKFDNPLISRFFFSSVDELMPLAPNAAKLRDHIPFFKSRIAPIRFHASIDHIELNEHIERAYSILNFPLAFSPGLLAPNISNPYYRMEMTIDPTHYNTRKLMEKRHKQVIMELENTKSDFEAKDLYLEKTGLEKTLAANNASQLNLMNVHLALYPSVSSMESIEKIEQDINIEFPDSDGWVYRSLRGLQGEIFKETSPLFNDSNLRQDQKQQIGTLMPCTSTAALWPYIFETLDDPKGALVGVESTTGGHIIFDIFQYSNNFDLAVKETRLNNNIFISGLSGSGKTTFVKMLIMQQIMVGNRVLYVDPENQVQNLVSRVGGVYIDWKTSDAMINVLDLKPQTNDDLNNPELIYNTKTAISNNTEDIKILYAAIHPDISDDELSVLDDVVRETYHSVGISEDTDFRHLSTNNYPTFSVLSSTIDRMLDDAKNKNMDEEFKYLQKLKIKTKPFTGSYARFFDGHTNFDDEKQFIAFGMKEAQNKSAKLMKALTRVVFQKAWEKTLDYPGQAVLAFDESHKYILEPGVAGLFAQFARRSRKYDVSCMFITQLGLDYNNDQISTNGQAVITNCAYKFLMQSAKDEYLKMQAIYELNDNQIRQMSKMPLGRGMFCIGQNRKILMNVFVTEEQIKMM